MGIHSSCERWHVLLATTATIILLSWSCFAAQPPSPADEEQPLEFQGGTASQTVVLGIQGKISKTLLANLKKTIDNLSDKRIPPGHFLVLIDSNGGDGEAAIEIGRLLRKNNAFVFITNRCASACVMVYLGGVYRSSIPFSIGIHPPRVTLSDRNARIVKEIQSDHDEIAKKMLSQYDVTTESYIKEMNIDVKFFDKLKSLNSPNLYWLSESEIRNFGIDGFDPLFAEKELRNLRKDFNPTLTQPDFIKQFNATLQNCVYLKNDNKAFAGCYRKNIQTSISVQ